MAGLPAERGRVHVRDAAIGRKTEDHNVQQCGEPDERQAIANHRRLQIHFRVDRRQFAAGAQLPPPEIDSNRDQQQADHKNSRQQQENQNADIRMGRTGKDEVINPEADKGYGAAGGQDHADQADGILAEVIQQLDPVVQCFLRIHRLDGLAFSVRADPPLRATNQDDESQRRIRRDPKNGPHTGVLVYTRPTGEITFSEGARTRPNAPLRRC